jgi:hypothetical protein
MCFSAFKSPGASQAAGSFVALCALLRQVAATSMMSVFSYCKYLRQADPLLLQDEDQYAFIHDAMHMALQQEKFLNKMNSGRLDFPGVRFTSIMKVRYFVLRYIVCEGRSFFCNLIRPT